MNQNTGLWFVLVLGALGFFSCLGWGWRLYQESNWIVTSAKADVCEGSEDGFVVQYSYEVGSKQYKAAENFGTFQAFNNAVKHSPLHPQAILNIEYDPSNPANAKLSQENSGKVGIIAIVCGSVSLLMSISAGLLLRKQRNEELKN